MLPPDKDEPKKSAASRRRGGQRRAGAVQEETAEDPPQTSPEHELPEVDTDAAPLGTEEPPTEKSRPEAEPVDLEASERITEFQPEKETYEPPLPEAEEIQPADVPRQSEPVMDTPKPLPPPAGARSGGRFWTALLGAVVGAALGAGAAWYVLERMPRPPNPEVTAALDQQAGIISAQADRVTAVEGEIGTLKETLASSDLSGALDTLRTESGERLGALDEAMTGLGGRLDTVQGDLGQIGGQVEDINSRLSGGDARIAELEARPIADPDTANQALRSEVADMRQEVEGAVEAARAQVETMRNELADAAASTQAEVAEAQRRAEEMETQARERAAAAEAEAQQAAHAAAAGAALAQIGAALDSGEPYGEALAALGTDVPAVLSDAAESGVPTLGELRESFPDAARAALRESRVASTEGEPVNRVMAFLRTQTQARSLAPKEGDTPDAILSRAEADLAAGGVAAALAELQSLPDDGRAAMQAWIDSAETRAAAVAAVETLSQDMN